MAANSPYIQLTLRLENATYKEFHAAVVAGGHSHAAVLRLLVKRWLEEKDAVAKPNSARQKLS